jgi:hypothetical protein
VDDQPQLKDELEIRIFTLCDHAALPPDGKLYIHGAGVQQVFLPQLPGPLTPLFLVVRLSVPLHMIGDPHTLAVRVLDLDRKPIGTTDPVLSVPFELGKPPGFRPGDDAAANLVAQLTGLPMQEPGTIRFHLSVDDQPLTSLPLKVQQLPPPTVAVLR